MSLALDFIRMWWYILGRHDIALGACANLESDIVGVNGNFGLPVLLYYPCDGSNEHFIFHHHQSCTLVHVFWVCEWHMLAKWFRRPHLWHSASVAGHLCWGWCWYPQLPHLPCCFLDWSGGGSQRIELKNLRSTSSVLSGTSVWWADSDFICAYAASSAWRVSKV